MLRDAEQILTVVFYTQLVLDETPTLVIFCCIPSTKGTDFMFVLLSFTLLPSLNGDVDLYDFITM